MEDGPQPGCAHRSPGLLPAGKASWWFSREVTVAQEQPPVYRMS